jgi:type II secretory pathway pseudopilin PulG
MKRSRGFTLLEVVLIISILLMLGYLIMPSIQNVRREALMASSMGKMRQLHGAMMLYVGEDHGDGPSGMGLPLTLGGLVRHYKLPSEILTTGGTPIPGLNRAVYTFMVPPNYAEPLVSRWQEHRRNTGDNPVLLVDDPFNPGMNPKFDVFTPKRAMAICWDGHIRKRFETGTFGDYSIWED